MLLTCKHEASVRCGLWTCVGANSEKEPWICWGIPVWLAEPIGCSGSELRVASQGCCRSVWWDYCPATTGIEDNAEQGRAVRPSLRREGKARRALCPWLGAYSWFCPNLHLGWGNGHQKDSHFLSVNQGFFNKCKYMNNSEKHKCCSNEPRFCYRCNAKSCILLW